MSNDSNSRVTIQPSGFGRDLPIPTARTVTVAKIASPFSIDKTYQEFFLRSLKNYFMFAKRLIRKGDLLAIPLQTELAALVKRCEAERSDVEGNSALVDPLSYGLVSFFCRKSSSKKEGLQYQGNGSRVLQSDKY